jgi:hypothetical protein
MARPHTDPRSSARRCPVRLFIVHERPTSARWVGHVESLFQAEPDSSSGGDLNSIEAGSLRQTAELRVLHGRRAWAEAQLLCGADRPSQVAFLVILRPWSSTAAARLLDQGADDVGSPSMDPGELCARLRAILRRISADGPADSGMRRAERRLLEYLRASPGRVVSHREILANVFGAPHAPDTSRIRVHVSHLRKRLPRGTVLKTIAGVGYLLDPGAAARNGSGTLLTNDLT